MVVQVIVQTAARRRVGHVARIEFAVEKVVVVVGSYTASAAPRQDRIDRNRGTKLATATPDGWRSCWTTLGHLHNHGRRIRIDNDAHGVEMMAKKFVSTPPVKTCTYKK